MKMKPGQAMYEQALKLAQSDSYDAKEVENLLIESSNLGNCDAQYALGSWYFYGKNVEISATKARNFWMSAAKNGSHDAALELAIAYEKGDKFKLNLRDAFIYYVIASYLGSSQAKFELGRFFYHGIFVPQNLPVYELLADKAEEDGYIDKD